MGRPAAAVLLASALGLAAGCNKDEPTAPNPARADAPNTPKAVANPWGDPPAPAADTPNPPAPPAKAPPTAPNPPKSPPPPKPAAPLPPLTAYAPTPAADQKEPPVGESALPTAPPVLPAPPPAAKAPDPKEPKEKMAGSVKTVEWPTDIYGRKPADFVKDLTDLDPFVRETALRTLPNFGPSMKKEAGLSKGLLARMDFTKEGDPGVRAAAFEAAAAIGFDGKADFDEAVRLLFVTADKAAPGSAGRLHAVTALITVGPKAGAAIPSLVGPPAEDPAWATRQAVAQALGSVGFNDQTGPSQKALECLAKNLAKDRSAAVRLAALQSLVVLGPPLMPRPPGAVPLKDVKNPADYPKRNEAAAVPLVEALRLRLAPVRPVSGEKPSATGVVEKDPQVEIFVRLVLMRFDPKEITDANLSGITKHLTGTETGVKLVALDALATLGGEPAARKLDEVVRLLSDENPVIVAGAATAIVAMGAGAKPAIPALEKLADKPGTKEEKEQWGKLSAEAVKQVKAAAGGPPAPPPADPKKP